MAIQYSGPSRVKFNEPAMRRLLIEPKGPPGSVGAYMRRLGRDIEKGAKRKVGVDSGALRNSIRMRHYRKGTVQYVVVGGYTPYAYMHHEGTGPHRISKTGGRIMSFKVGGRVVVVQKVNHPGTRANPYLRIPMERAVRRGI